MDRGEKAVFANMCMIYDNDDNVLVINRTDPNWSGITFPGGHVEKKESFTDSVIREVYEETGLHIMSPQLCGIKQWTNEDDSRYAVLFYKTNQFHGELISSEEGEVMWVKLKDLLHMNIANGMEDMLRVFLEDDISEHYIYKENGEWKSILK